MARVVAMLGTVCPCCMRHHPAPACKHDSTSPCQQCHHPVGYLTPEMDGSACWFCFSGRPRPGPRAPWARGEEFEL